MALVVLSSHYPEYQHISGDSTVWWSVAALQLISPLFLPPPGQVLQN